MVRPRLAALWLGVLPASGLLLSGSACGENSTAAEIAAGADLRGRVAVVTGGDAGLGYAIAGALARQGATVVLAGRSTPKCLEAAQALSAATGGMVTGAELDLSSFASVRAFAQRVLLEHDGRLNYLVNNAGMVDMLYYGETLHKASLDGGPITEDGFERVFQVNYLGHFLLTELLLPALRRSGPPARVVNTASSMHAAACEMVSQPEDCLQAWDNLPPQPQPPRQGTNYGISKFAQIQHARELARREAGTGVEAVSLCPGVVDTKVWSSTDSFNNKLTFADQCRRLVPAGSRQEPCPYTAQEGAAVLAFCTLRAVRSGGYYTRYDGCSEAAPTGSGFSEVMQRQLYHRSQRWVGIVD